MMAKFRPRTRRRPPDFAIEWSFQPKDQKLRRAGCPRKSGASTYRCGEQRCVYGERTHRLFENPGRKKRQSEDEDDDEYEDD